MATKYDANALIPSGNNTSHLRGWAQWVEDLLVTTGGWTVTSDTGQTAISSLTAPSTALTTAGYRVYSMSDGGQAMKMKVEFGTGTSATYPCIWVTIGSGSDGAGTLTGVIFNRTYIQASAGTTTNQGPAYGSAATNRACFCLWATATTYSMWFLVERTRDANGNGDATGIIVAWGSNQTHYSQYCPFSGPIVGTPESGLHVLLSTNDPSSVNGNFGIAIPFPMYGFAQRPGISCAVANSNDVSALSQVTISVYGTNRTYQQVSGPSYLAVGGNNRPLNKLGLLYE